MFHLFINFKPDNTKAYGGGNITTYYIQKYFQNKYNNFKITYELQNSINLYLIIDPFKDNKFKKYSLEEIVNHRNTYNKHGKIIIRVNDCDITRPNLPPERSREKLIIKNSSEINYYIFNSEFIKNHYKKFINVEKSVVIYNGCDTSIFYPQSFIKPQKYRIVTHHWSNNMNKGYQMYYDLWFYLKKTENYEFVFIGQNVPEMFKDVPIIGPYVGLELSNSIRDCHIYITDSIYDSCPNHVIEAISCGLPILYRKHEGGARELCELFPKKIGESYSNLEELIEKIVMIRKKYLEYKSNVQECTKYFELSKQISKYDTTFLSVLFQKKIKIGEIKEKGSYTLCLKISSIIDHIYLKINEQWIHIIPGKIYHVNALFEKQTIYLFTNTEKKKITIDYFDCKPFSNIDKYKLMNDKLNILYSSDRTYFTPMFASLHSVIKNSRGRLENIHFNFIIPIEDSNYFQNMISEYENKFDYTIIFIDKMILDKEILNSKCYDGGKHLLNIGNFSRLMIGELFSYPKLLYLDSDSICKMNVESLIKLDTTNKIYCLKADKKNSDNKRSLVLKIGALINDDYGKKNNINLEEFAYYGAPILTDCRIWRDVYSKIVQIIGIHNKTDNGIYKLFTMSLQNIIFYGKMEDIYLIIRTLPDLGSKRKEWTKEDIENADILDWSGVYKPWFRNGLYKEEWDKYNIMPFLEEVGEVEYAKKTVEKFVG
jgi:lipopolysaccharide biosynthesis glycosyltransferase/glycosyltransferase involved in cell wall biosynthesis